MSQRNRNGHISSTRTAFSQSAHGNDNNGVTSALLDAKWWAAFLLAALCFGMNMVVVPVACICTLYLFLYPIRLFSIPLFTQLEHELCRLVNDAWMSASKYCGLNVVEYGDDIRPVADARALCLVNHLGLIDHFCLMTSFHDKGSLAGKYMWVIFNIWKWNPVGLMWTAHGNFFVQGSGIGEAKRLQLLDRFKQHLRKNYWKFDYGWVIMYPEGSRFFVVEEAEKQFCKKRGIQPFRCCTHPRVGAAHAVLEICGTRLDQKGIHNGKLKVPSLDKIEYIIDCTLGYHKGAVPHFGRCLLGIWPFERSKTVAVHYRVHKVNPEWSTNAELFKNWLYEQYGQKDKLLAHFYATGKFLSQPDDENSPPLKGRPIMVSDLRCLMVNFIWLALFFFHANMLFRPCLRIFSAILAAGL